MARTRTTKKLAQRIDLNYFKRPTGLKRAKFLLSVGLPALALIWITWHGFARDSRVYSSGRMSEAHAVLEAQCAACHVQTAGTFSAKAGDAACLSCHDGPIHHASQIGAASCVTCHAEHRGRVNLVAASNASCATCHGDLSKSSSATHFQSSIYSFEKGHPEFAAVRGDPRDPGTIRVNHAIHMKPIRRGPNGPNVQLECGDCHQAAAATVRWPYADTKYTSAKTSYSMQDELLAGSPAGLPRATPASGRELMAPVKFANGCEGCHLLTFDKRFDEGVPHDTPEVVHAFLLKKFGEYIAAHPTETREVREPGRDLSGKPLAAAVRMLTPAQWVMERTAEAEDLLSRKTCKQCHTLSAGEGLPQIAPAKTTLQWMPHSRFDHDAHRGFSCTSCHEKALTSTESSDVLLPGVATCKTCHAPGPEHAESRCFECHTYHDWSKRKEIKPTFTPPALQTGAS
ncbi:MAG: hypothetical protein WBF09_11785 [Candidatus Acidiferrum sp.]